MTKLILDLGFVLDLALVSSCACGGALLGAIVSYCLRDGYRSAGYPLAGACLGVSAALLAILYLPA